MGPPGRKGWGMKRLKRKRKGPKKIGSVNTTKKEKGSASWVMSWEVGWMGVGVQTRKN